MKQKLLSTLFLLLAIGKGALAQTTVTTESELRTAVQTSQTVTLGADIALADGRLVIDGTTVSLNLNSHQLSRSRPAANQDGQVVFLQNSGKLTLTDNDGDNGKITGGWSFQGGAIYVGTGCELTVSGGTLTATGYATDSGIRCYGGATINITGGTIFILAR